MASPLRFLLAFAALAFAPQVLAQHLYLWEVSSLTNRVYLYGTVHAGKQSWYPLPARVEAALEDAHVLVVEADVTDTAALAKSGSVMTLTPPDKLRDHVPEDEYKRFVKLLPRYGLREEQVSQVKPFMAVSLLVFSEWGRNGFFPQYGIEQYLIKKARAELKPVLELEGVAAQVKLMESLTDLENRQLFVGTVKALETDLTSEQIKGMVAAWEGGDPRGMLEIARKYNESVPGAREFEEKFIWSRHDAMAKKIEGYLNDTNERHFVAVGSLHLAGDRGLVEMLRRRGYVVKQR
jgi:uncharacterized protein YbaP (TraB family)